MSARFPRTHRALASDGPLGSVVSLVLAATLLGAWLGWSVLARVSLYEVSAAARVETGHSTHVIQIPVEGRLTSSTMVLGRRVQAGEELARIDAGDSERQHLEQQRRLAALAAEQAAVRNELASIERTKEDEQLSSTAAIAVAQSRVREAQAPAGVADQDAARARQLLAAGLVAASDADRAQAVALQHREALDGLQLTITQLHREQRVRERERDVHIARLRAESTRLDGLIAVTRATIDRLQFDIDRYVVRAPIAGSLADITILKPGAVVKTGDRLAAILPDTGALLVVAEFAPASAIGRIRAGQPARLRLHGFPWTQYGSVSATVERVASEIRDGTVRVELRVRETASAIPLQHGLPGSIEIEVEQISPVALALRLAGRLTT